MRTETRIDRLRALIAPSAPTFLRLPAVIRRTGLSRSTILRRVDKDFPAPVRLGPNAVAWVAEEVDAWAAARIAERDQAGAR